MFQRKNEGFHLGEQNNEDSNLLLLIFFCNIKIDYKTCQIAT